MTQFHREGNQDSERQTGLSEVTQPWRVLGPEPCLWCSPHPRLEARRWPQGSGSTNSIFCMETLKGKDDPRVLQKAACSMSRYRAGWPACWEWGLGVIRGAGTLKEEGAWEQQTCSLQCSLCSLRSGWIICPAAAEQTCRQRPPVHTGRTGTAAGVALQPLNPEHGACLASRPKIGKCSFSPRNKWLSGSPGPAGARPALRSFLSQWSLWPWADFGSPGSSQVCREGMSWGILQRRTGLYSELYCPALCKGAGLGERGMCAGLSAGLPSPFIGQFFLWISVSPTAKRALDHIGADIGSGVVCLLLGTFWPFPMAPHSVPPLGTSHKECGGF